MLRLLLRIGCFSARFSAAADAAILAAMRAGKTFVFF
jgi:hypothetical protein